MRSRCWSVELPPRGYSGVAVEPDRSARAVGILTGAFDALAESPIPSHPAEAELCE
jgi:hypothetical protein